MKRLALFALALTTSFLSAACATYDARPMVFFEEAKGWDVPGTRTSAVVEDRCGLLLEARLKISRHTNAVWVLGKNYSDKTIEFDIAGTQMIFDDGTERLPEGRLGRVILEAGKKFGLMIPFPSKSQFKDARGVDVRLAFKSVDKGLQPDKGQSCVASLPFVHDPGKEIAEETYSDRAGLITSFEFGAPISRSGNLNLAAPLSLALGLDLAFYGQHNGFFFGFMYEGRKTPSSDYLPLPSGVANRSDLVIDGGYFVLGYTRRIFIGDKFDLRYDVGPGLYLIDYGTTSNPSAQIAAPFALVQKVSLYYRRTIANGEFGVGLSLYDGWLPSGSLQGVSLSGNTLGLVGGIRFGAL